MRQKCIIVQLEGVLSNDSSRRYLIEPELPIKGHISPGVCRGCGEYKDECVCPLPIKKPDPEAYHAASDQDEINEWCENIVNQFSYHGWEIIFITDMTEKHRQKIQDYLFKVGIPIRNQKYKLFMRPDFLPLIKNPIRKSCEMCFRKAAGKMADIQLPNAVKSDGQCFFCGGLRRVIEFSVPVPIDDTRPYDEIKREIFEREIKDRYDVLFVLDRDEGPWKGLGLQVLKVM